MAEVDMCSLLSDNLLKFEKSTECLDLFMDPQQGKNEIFKSISKNLYDIAQSGDIAEVIPLKGLPKLIINGFDDEQIWQQLDLQSIVISFCSKYVKKLDFENLNLGIDTSFGAEENDINADESAFSDASEEEYAFDGSDTDDTDALEDAVESKITERSDLKKCSSNGKKSIVDDEFFKLHEMEEFLQSEDLKFERGMEELSDGSDDLEFFEDIPSDECGLGDSSDEEDALEAPSGEELDLLVPPPKKDKKSARDLMYEDYFGPSQEVTKPSDLTSSREKDGSFCCEDENYPEYVNDEMEYGDEPNSQTEEKHIDDDHDDTSSEKKLKLVAKTAFEMQQKKERQMINQMHESLLMGKSWHLTGEVDASSRPKDSLINQETEFDSNIKQCDITDVDNNLVEEIVKMAIMNKAWSDVEKQVKPLDVVTTYKPPVELDQTKSKKSLAELYEDDYKKQQQKEKEDDPKHIEITKMMNSLIPQLNALFCHIPKPPVPEIKMVNNLPAITIEEVAPTFVSDAALLAPEEIKAKPAGVEVAKSERTDTDKKRERRKKKKFQKFRKLQDEDRERKNAASSKFAAKKYAKSEAMKKIQQNKNTIIASGSQGMKVKSSKDFFSRLQDTVSSKLSSAKASNTNDKKRKYSNLNMQT